MSDSLTTNIEKETMDKCMHQLLTFTPIFTFINKLYITLSQNLRSNYYILLISMSSSLMTEKDTMHVFEFGILATL